MNIKKEQLIPILLAVSILGVGVGYVLSKPGDFGICERSVACYYLDLRGSGIYYGMTALAIVFFLLLLVPKAFDAWKKFAVWFVPIFVLLVITYVDSPDFGWYPTSVYLFFAKVYVAISVLIIGWKYWQLNKNKK